MGRVQMGREPMTSTEIGVMAAVSAQALFGLRWLLGLEGRIAASAERISAHERECAIREKNHDERNAAILVAIQDLRHDLKARRE